MKLKFPESIVIGDNKFKIILDETRCEGEFYYWEEDKDKNLLPPTLIIGTKLLNVSPLRVLGTIVHELKEIIHIEQQSRYRSDDGSIKFVYNHQEHSELCSWLVGLLDLFIE